MNDDKQDIFESFMKRGYLFLEDKNWDEAKAYFEKALDIDPENSKAYIGALLAELNISHEKDIIYSDVVFDYHMYYQKRRF